MAYSQIIKAKQRTVSKRQTTANDVLHILGKMEQHVMLRSRFCSSSQACRNGSGQAIRIDSIA